MPAKLRSIAFLPTRLAAGALAAAMMVGSATPAWAEPSAKLVKCAAGHCLLVSGHREDAASPVRINGHAVAVEGRRNWRARLPLESVREWSAPFARSITVASGDEQAEQADLPIGLLGHVTDLASLVISAP